MNLELLPNEILLDLFDYFNDTDLFRSFHGLNSRFNYLLYNQFRHYHFKFISISKHIFDMICQQHLPLIADRVISLSLSESSTTPEQINLFLSYTPSFRQFIQLRSLLLGGISSYTTLLEILHQCQYICNLTCLSIYDVNCQVNQADFQSIINSIWSLPKLIHCSLRIRIKHQSYFVVPTNISISLESVFIYNHSMELNDIKRLYEYTPCLKRLHVFLRQSRFDHYMPFTLSTLTNLHLFMDDVSDDLIVKSLQNTSNLCRLNINLQFHFINGYQWEQIISKYLPKLQVFKLRMQKTSFSDQYIQEYPNELINSFQSSFWIYEHQWFVRCITIHSTIYLHTLSEKFDYSQNKLPDSLKSTCPYDDYREFYTSITSISNEKFFDQSIPPYIRLPNIRNLSIKLPINDQFWSIVPNLNRLDVLSVSSYAGTFHSQLQILLNQAPRLHQLTIRQYASLPSQKSLFKYTNASVRTLNLENYNHSFNKEECITLSRSPLGVQCEELSIQVTNRESIISLIKNMVNLRSLNVKYNDERYCERLTDIEKNDLISLKSVKY